MIVCMCVFGVSSDYCDTFFTDATNDYSIHLHQATKSSELQVAVFSVSLCQPVYAEVGEYLE